MKKFVANILVAILVVGLLAWRLSSQTPPVDLISAPAGSTLANCGTPTVPSLCLVSPGVFAWQNATQGWFLLAPAVASVGVQKVNGVAPGATGNVALSCPGTTPATAVSVTPSVSASGATATITAAGSVPSMTVTNTCTAVGN
jgi:hypothetical protein